MLKTTISVLVSTYYLFGSQALANTQNPDFAEMANKVVTLKKVTQNNIYLVRLAENSIAAYDGSVKGLKATKPGKNKKLNPNNKNVIAYGDYLTDKHDALLASVGASNKLYSYKYSYNGFTAELTPAQVSKLRSNAEVLSVLEDEKMQLDTISTSSFLKLDATDGSGFWEAIGGKHSAGENVIVGIIDSGVWRQNMSFSDRRGTNSKGKTGKLNYHQIPGWHGKCTPGEEFPASDCNEN